MGKQHKKFYPSQFLSKVTILAQFSLQILYSF